MYIYNLLPEVLIYRKTSFPPPEPFNIDNPKASLKKFLVTFYHTTNYRLLTFQRVYISIKAPKIHTSALELKQRPSLRYYECKSYFIWNCSCKMTVSKAV